MPSQPAREPFGYCLNTSTIRGAGLPIDRELEIAAKAGFRAVEPWIEEIEEYVKRGGTTGELRRRFEDLGLSVAGAVGFAEWIVEDDARRSTGLERMARDMALVAEIGGRHIASPPIGAHQTDQPKPSLPQIAERYAAILELGKRMGVTPILELWGFSQTLSRLGEVLYVAAETAHLGACLLLDSYHLYKGGPNFQEGFACSTAPCARFFTSTTTRPHRLASRSTTRTASTPATASRLSAT